MGSTFRGCLLLGFVGTKDALENNCARREAPYRADLSH